MASSLGPSPVDNRLNSAEDEEAFLDAIIQPPESDNGRNWNVVGARKKRSRGSNSSPAGNASKRNSVVSEDQTYEILEIKGVDENIMSTKQVKLLTFLADNGIRREDVRPHKEYLTVKSYDRNLTQKLINTKQILGKEVIVSIKIFKPKTSLSSPLGTMKKVIIFGVPLYFEDEEILSETGCDYFKRLPAKQESDTSPVILGYGGDIPAKILIGFSSFKPKLYIPQPLRCFKCNKFGHVASRCLSKLTCPRCASNHKVEDCQVPKYEANNINSLLKCSNCGGNHSAAYKLCPVYAKSQAILALKTSNKMSYAEAAECIAKQGQNPDSELAVQHSLSKDAQNRDGIDKVILSNINTTSSAVIMSTIPVRNIEPTQVKTRVNDPSADHNSKNQWCSMLESLIEILNLLVSISVKYDLSDILGEIVTLVKAKLNCSLQSND